MLTLAVFLIAANIVFSVCFYFLMRKRFSHERVLRDVEKELDLLYKDLQHEIDNSLSIIDDRTAALKNLIAAADKRILLAASEIEKREKASSFAASRLESAKEADKEEKSEKDAPLAAVYTKRQVIEKAAEARARRASEAAIPAKGIEPEIPAREQVVMLARQDISPDEIAKILSLPRSEVDLILALDL